MQDLPRGTVTFLFTDIEGSTRLLRENRPSYGEILGGHAQILRTAFETHGGWEVDTQGDSFFAAFRTARDAVEAAVAAQQALATHSWPGDAEPKVRMGMHTGEPVVSGDRYVGLAVHRAARICAAAHGGQVLLSSTTCSLVADELPVGTGMSDLGEHQLKDFDRPERIFQLVIDGQPSVFPPPRTLTTELPAAADEGTTSPAWLPHVLRGRPLWLFLALGLLVLTALVGVIAARTGESASEVPRRSLAVIDPSTNEVTDSVPLASSAGPVIAFGGAIWTASPDDRTLIEIDPQSHKVIGRAGVGIAPHSLAPGDGFLWIGGEEYDPIVQFLPRTGDIAEPAALSGSIAGYSVISAVQGGLWFGGNDEPGVAHFDVAASRIDKTSGRSLTPEAIAASDGAVWVVDRFGQEVVRLDPATGAVLDRVPLGSPIPSLGASTVHTPLSNALLDASGLWVSDALEGKLWRIRPAESSIRSVISVGQGALALTSGAGSVWVANRGEGTVSRIDPQTDRVAATIKIADQVDGAAFAAGKVWVVVP
jgi:YVTN family beta-propeller protein